PVRASKPEGRPGALAAPPLRVRPSGQPAFAPRCRLWPPLRQLADASVLGLQFLVQWTPSSIGCHRPVAAEGPDGWLTRVGPAGAGSDLRHCRHCLNHIAWPSAPISADDTERPM